MTPNHPTSPSHSPPAFRLSGTLPRRFGLLIALAAAVTSCGGDGGTEPRTVDSIVVNPGIVGLSSFGATAQLSASARDGDGAPISGTTFDWSSSRSDIATVDPSTGLVTAVDNGLATITARANGVSGTATVTVDDPAAVGPNGHTITVGSVMLTFPPGAVAQPVTITVDPAVGFPAFAGLVDGTAFDFGPDGAVFAVPVEVTITYDPADIPAGVAEGSLQVLTLDQGNWVPVAGSTVDENQNTVTASLDGFSTYGAGAVAPAFLVVNEVENRAGGSPHGGDYVELLANADGSLEGYSVVMVTVDGQPYGEVELMGMVQKGEFILMGSAGVNGADYTFGGLQDGPGAVRIFGPEAAVSGPARQFGGGAVVDAVEWAGSLGVGEGAPVPFFPMPTIIQRVADAFDTDHNSTDFCVNEEDDRTPGAPNAECETNPGQSFLGLFFLDDNDDDLTEIELQKDQVYQFDARVVNLDPPAEVTAQGVMVGTLTSDNPNLVQARDLGPFTSTSLGVGFADRHRVEVKCLMAQGQTTVRKDATASTDPPPHMAEDALVVKCGDTSPPPNDPPPPPEPPPFMTTQLRTTWVDPDGGCLLETPSPQIWQVNQPHTLCVLMENLGPGNAWISNVARPTKDPDGLLMTEAGTYPPVKHIPPIGNPAGHAPSVDEREVELTCPEPDWYRPMATADGDTPTGPVTDSDDFWVLCMPPVPPELAGICAAEDLILLYLWSIALFSDPFGLCAYSTTALALGAVLHTFYEELGPEHGMKERRGDHTTSRRVGGRPASLSGAAIERLFELLADFPGIWEFSGSAPTAPAGADGAGAELVPPPPGGYFVVFNHLMEPLPLADPTNYYQYGFVLDSDGNPNNNYAPGFPFTYDSYRDTDLFYDMAYDPAIGWNLVARDATNGNIQQVPTGARLYVQDSLMLLLIPMSEIPSATPDIRFTTFRHTGDFGVQEGNWDGDVQPPQFQPLYMLPIMPPP